MRSAGKGAERKSLSVLEWDISGRCTQPYVLELAGRPDPGLGGRHVVVRPGERHTLYADLTVPCRACAACLRARRRLWTQRAIVETRSSARTWFVTLTLSPDAHVLMRYRALQRLRRASVNIDVLTEDEQQAEVHNEIGAEITKYIKRVRKNSAAPMRYLCAAEKHKSGLPHYHLLIHEQFNDKPIRWKTLAQAWRLGFGTWKLVDDSLSVAYVCKYLSKSTRARVRASCRYGGGPTPFGITSEIERGVKKIDKRKNTNSEFLSLPDVEVADGISSSVPEWCGSDPGWKDRLSTSGEWSDAARAAGASAVRANAYLTWYTNHATDAEALGPECFGADDPFAEAASAAHENAPVAASARPRIDHRGPLSEGRRYRTNPPSRLDARLRSGQPDWELWGDGDLVVRSQRERMRAHRSGDSGCCPNDF